MDLARLAAARARQEAEDLAKPPAHDPEAPNRPAAPASPRPRDPILAFTRLSTAIRMAMVLETRIAAGPIPTGRQRRRPPPDPRRQLLRTTFEEGTGRHPDRKRLLRESLERLEEQLAADPNVELTANDIIDIICEDLGFEIDFALISDETLQALSGVTLRSGAYDPEPDPDPNPDPWDG